jgi:hypothetical protein
MGTMRMEAKWEKHQSIAHKPSHSIFLAHVIRKYGLRHSECRVQQVWWVQNSASNSVHSARKALASQPLGSKILTLHNNTKEAELPDQLIMDYAPLKICIAGAGGIPGRNILSSLLSNGPFEHALTVLRRPATKAVPLTKDGPHQSYQTVFVDFDDRSSLTQVIETLKPNVMISALNAEPGPLLDTKLVNSTVDALTSTNWEDQILFINGYTLDIMHPSVSNLQSDQLDKMASKREFAGLLDSTSNKYTKFEYATIVNAAFLDYTLIKGYTGIDLEAKTAIIYDGGNNELTGCSLQFVGDAVVELIRQRFFGTHDEVEQVRNKRVKIAETTYSGRQLLEAVETVTGAQFLRNEQSSQQLPAIGQLNWDGQGAAAFVPGGLEFGTDGTLKGKRRTLVDIVKRAVEDGRGAFEDIGR